MSNIKKLMMAAQGASGAYFSAALRADTTDPLNNLDIVYGSYIDSDGYIYSIGYANLDNGSGDRKQQCTLAKRDASGTLIWIKSYFDGYRTLGYGIVEDSNGYLWLSMEAGVSSSIPFGVAAYVQIDKDGNYQKHYSFKHASVNVSGYYAVRQPRMAIDGSDTIYSNGTYINQSTGKYDTYLLKINTSNGSLIWDYRYSTNANGGLELRGGPPLIDSSGDIIVLGESGANSGTYESMGVMKVDSSGNILWSRVYGHPSDFTYAMGGVLDPSDNLYFTGSWAASGTTNYIIFVAQVSSSGTLTSPVNIFSGFYDTRGYGITRDPSTGDLYVVGFTNSASISSGGNSGVMHSIDSTLSSVNWTRTFDDSAGENMAFLSVNVDESSSDVVAVGYNRAQRGAGKNDGWTVRSPADGVVTGTYDTLTVGSVSYNYNTSSAVGLRDTNPFSKGSVNIVTSSSSITVTDLTSPDDDVIFF